MTSTFAAGTQLAQVRPPTAATPVAAIPAAGRDVGRRVEVTRVHIVAGATGATASIYQDRDGTTRSADTIIWTEAVPANTTRVISSESLGGGITVDRGGEIAVESSVAGEITFTFWGVVESMRQG